MSSSSAKQRYASCTATNVQLRSGPPSVLTNSTYGRLLSQCDRATEISPTLSVLTNSSGALPLLSDTCTVKHREKEDIASQSSIEPPNPTGHATSRPTIGLHVLIRRCHGIAHGPVPRRCGESGFKRLCTTTCDRRYRARRPVRTLEHAQTLNRHVVVSQMLFRCLCTLVAPR